MIRLKRNESYFENKGEIVGIVNFQMSSQYIHEPSTAGKVILHTTVGDIEVELWTKEAPLTCRNFIQLCMEGYYNETIFHRLVKDFIIQGGDPTGTGQGGESIYGKTFKDEFHQRLRFNRRALLGMANAGKDMNGSQFFITLGAEPARELDRKHTLFGKITGPTVFNMLRMAETEVDNNERPKTINKILKTTVVLNPFDDIVPREKEKKRKKEKKEEKPKVEEKKKLNLLSFGDEAEEEEMEIEKITKKLVVKGKSAHDALSDERLSKEVAVRREEMGDYDRNEEMEEDGDVIRRVREKLGKKRKIGEKKDEEEKEKERDVDFEEMIDEERRAREKEEVERKQAEVKAVQKEYIKALRPKKEKPKPAEPDATDNMKKYESMKMKFKDKSKNLVKAKDPKREGQTDNLMDRFKSRLGASNQTAILFDKKIEIAEKKEEKEGEEEEFGVDLDAEDEADFGWINNKFVAHDEIDANVTRAKDANMRETSEDWYLITDPRNPINKRRRGEI